MSESVVDLVASLGAAGVVGSAVVAEEVGHSLMLVLEGAAVALVASLLVEIGTRVGVVAGGPRSLLIKWGALVTGTADGVLASLLCIRPIGPTTSLEVAETASGVL